MLLLRAVFLDLLLSFHVIGAAVLFRRFFPRENPWLAFLVPTLGLVMALNFVEHFVALPTLGWLLPLTLGGLLWAILSPGYSWEGLRFPSVLFVALLTFILILKCLAPDIRNYCEGTHNLERVLSYSLGGTLPQIDCFMPPYNSGGYYSFQHYGASVLKRLFFVDVGTAYNVSFVFLLAWTCLMAGGVAHSISGKIGITVATVLVVMAGSTGSVPFLILYGRGADYALSTSLNSAWDDPARNPFAWICAHDKYHPILTLVSPTYSLYWPEFHATLGGSFVTMASLLAGSEVFKFGRSNWPWICLLVLPMVVIITSAWFFIIIVAFCGGSVILAFWAGRRPGNWGLVIIASAVALVFLWPSVFSMTGTSNETTQQFSWTKPEEHTPWWMFALQWWPVYLPWLFLCFAWGRLNLMGRWIHITLAVLLIGVEFVTVANNRSLTTEKMWGAIYGAGLATLLPLLLMQKGAAFRTMSALLVLVGVICLGSWVKTVFYDAVFFQMPFGHDIGRLQGDYYFQTDPQEKRLIQVLSRLHGATILPGKSSWAYNDAPEAISFSGNRCYIAYTYQEWQFGQGGEDEYRNDINNKFYAGTLTAPLPFLRSNNIAAVLIWPQDEISDQLLQQFQTQLGSDYFYIDCKMDGTNNAGVFMRQTASPVRTRAISP
jgi:hypothetical protein